MTFAAVCLSQASAQSVPDGTAPEPSVTDVTPTGANTLNPGTGTTNVGAKITGFPANTNVTVQVSITNTNHPNNTGGITTFPPPGTTYTTDANGSLTLTGLASNTPAGSSGDAGSITVEVSGGGVTKSGSTTTPTFK